MFGPRIARPQEKARQGPIQKPLPNQSASDAKASAPTRAEPGVAPKTVREALDSPGQPLDPTTRRFMEPRFGHDFSRIRIHADSRAGESTRAIGAEAYTAGEHIVFGRGRYAPDTPAGRELLAHELTHHVQQSAAIGLSRGHANAKASASAEAEAEADRNATRMGGGAGVEVNVRTPVGIAMKGSADPAADHSFWFQSKPPEKAVDTPSGIQIAPKGQAVLDPATTTIPAPGLGTLTVQFAGMDTDFQMGKPRPGFAAAEKLVVDAIRNAIGDLGSLPEIKNAPSQAAAEAQRHEDLTARARLKEAARTLDGKTLNIFIASDLSVAEALSAAPLSLRTEQIFVRPEDVGNAAKLEAGIRVPLIALTGGVKGVAPGPGGKQTQSSVTALTSEQAKEAVLHEMVHVMLINKGVSAVQVWAAARSGLVTGPDDVKALTEDVLFRYVRAQEEIFVYTAIAGVYSGFAANKDHYVDYVKLVEALLHDLHAGLEKPKSTPIDVQEKIGEGKKKEGVKWSIAYTLPKPFKIDATQTEALKLVQKFDIGS